MTTTPTNDLEKYRSHTKPGVDCPHCLVDTGDSDHVIGCPIGEALGCATRQPTQVHPDQWTGEGIAEMLAANPEPPAWYEQPDR